jgi:hypothetical protein
MHTEQDIQTEPMIFLSGTSWSAMDDEELNLRAREISALHPQTPLNRAHLQIIGQIVSTRRANGAGKHRPSVTQQPA